MNVLLLLAPNSGFLFEWHGCQGLYGRNYGVVSAAPVQLRLNCELPNTPGEFANIASELAPVRWGQRHYLVPTAEFVRFCNAVNSGQEPRPDVHGSFLLRRGDESKPAHGKPGLPERYARMLLGRPITGQIMEVGKIRYEPATGRDRTRYTPVVLDVGSVDGVFVGMELYLAALDEALWSVTVDEVGEHECRATAAQYVAPDARPHRGAKVSSEAWFYRMQPK